MTSCEGKEFSRPAVTQREMVRLLQQSPLPWTFSMLKDWFGTRLKGPLECALNFGRIKRIAPGLYSCPCKTKGIKVIVTDDMLKKYGFNL